MRAFKRSCRILRRAVGKKEQRFPRASKSFTDMLKVDRGFRDFSRFTKGQRVGQQLFWKDSRDLIKAL